MQNTPEKPVTSLHRRLSLAICLSIMAALILTGCSRNSATTQPVDTVQPTNTVQPSPTKIPPTNTPKPKPTNVPPTNTPKPSATNPPAPTANPILNINWQWMSVTEQSSGVKTSVPEPNKYTIAFFADGTVSGKADCNTFSGTYSQQNGLSIKLGVSTSLACGEASLDQQYLKLLSNVAAGGPDGVGGLALETAGGAQRMLFTNGGVATKP
jgi:heat shock protein HslJ